MTTSHYDVIILGESLASRIAAVLLTKAGRRVLTVDVPPALPPSPAWIPVSLHLERLLDLLDDRSCLVPATPFQVLSEPVRLTFHGVTARLDELHREFPKDSQQVQSLFHELEDIGDRLETALWECGGLPLTGWASRWRFFYRRLFKGLTRRKLFRPLASILKAGVSAQTSQALAALFSGLALCSIEDLTVAEGALLWRSFSDNRGVSAVALNALLTRRFEQFHGESIQLDNQNTLQTVNGRPHELALNDGRRCSASVFLLGSHVASALLPEELRPGNLTLAPSPLRFMINDGAASPLLAPIVILDGPPTLRLTQASDTATDKSRIICQAAAPASATSTNHCQDRLAALLPFATLCLEPPDDRESATATSGRRQKVFPGAVSSLVVEKNLLCCCGEQVLPSLGAVGEAMVGIGIFNQLQRQNHF